MTAGVCFPLPLIDADEPMLGLLDAQGYTRMLDLRTGDAANCESALVPEVAEVIGRRPYPGDNREEADTWVTDVALELVKSYPAELVMLDYAQALFIALNRGEDDRRALRNVFNNVERFLSATGYVPMIFGCGGLEPIEEVVDLEDLFEDGDVFALTSGKYAYIDAAQMERLEPRKRSRLEQLAKVLTRKEFLGSLEGGFSPQFAEDLGDYVAVAKAGVVFRGLGSLGRQHRYAMALHDTVSVNTLLEAPRSICDVAPIVRREVAKGVKVALIIVEGADAEDFPLPTKQCRNRSGEFVYQAPWQQYYTLSTGIPYYRYHSPLSNRHWIQDNRYYPFSGRLHRPADGALGQSIGARRSLAVGNRSINTHVFLGADVSVECYCCYMHNHGSLAVFRGKALRKG